MSNIPLIEGVTKQVTPSNNASYVATYHKVGKHRKSFAVRTFGEENAKKMAINQRREWEEEFDPLYEKKAPTVILSVKFSRGKWHVTKKESTSGVKLFDQEFDDQDDAIEAMIELLKEM